MNKDKCPKCGSDYIKKVVLDSRVGKTVNIERFDRLCQVAEKRKSGPVAGHKSTRADSERYKFVGYLHRE